MATFAPPRPSRLARLWPTARIRARVLERVRRRRGTIAPPYRLEYRNVFILPTQFGFAFGVMLIFTALGGLNFNNNLALLLVFVLGALAQTTTLLAYRNLAGLDINALRSEPVFAGEPAHFLLDLHNPATRHRFTVQGSVATDAQGDCKDLGPNQSASLRLTVPTHARGWLPAPAVRIETCYPLGLFRAWSWVFPDARCLVYPRPAQDAPPLPTLGEGQAGLAKRGEGDQLHGLRGYRDGDPLKTIAWRSSARHDQLLTREMEAPQEVSCELRFDQLTGLNTEQRLSVLTAWVLMADHRQLTFRLVLPDRELGPAAGPGQRAAALEALALFES